jgi:hypothetical protein
MHGLGPATIFLTLSTAPEGAGSPPASEVSADTSEPAPRHKGTGMLATTGALGGTSLVLTITRNILFRKNCPLDDGSAATCTYDISSDLGLAATQWSANFAMVGFAPGAGYMLGKYHAWKDANEGRERKIGTIMGTGGGLLGAGVLGLGTSIALVFVLPKRCLDKEIGSGDPLAGDRCLLKAYPAWTMVNWASFAMIGSGAAMLAYGSAYQKRRGPRAAQWQLAPQAGRGYAGLGLSGQF